MKKVWYEENPGLFKQVKAEVGLDYPNLHFYPSNGTILIKGTFPVLHEGKVLDRYSIEIYLLKDYPESVPVVREVGGRIPWTADRHMSVYGVACLFLPDERWEVYPADTKLTDFIKGPMHNFFLGQSLVQRGQPWPFGENPHGAKGIRDYYSRLLSTDNSGIILKFLEYLSKQILKGHWECPCGSGKRLRHCHFDMLLDLRSKIPPHITLKSWNALQKYEKEEALKRK